MLRAERSRNLLVFAAALLFCALFAGCGRPSDTQPYAEPPDEAYIQNIAQLNMLEEVKDISARRGLTISKAPFPDTYDIYITDRWTLQNNSDQEQRFTAAYATGYPFISKTEDDSLKVRINGVDSDYTQRAAYLKYYYGSGFQTVADDRFCGKTKPDSLGTMKKKLANKEYLKNALTEPDGEILDKKAYLYTISDSYDDYYWKMPLILFRCDFDQTEIYSRQPYKFLPHDGKGGRRCSLQTDKLPFTPKFMMVVVGEDIYDTSLATYTEDGDEQFDPNEWKFDALLERRSGTLRDVLGWVAEEMETDVDNYRWGLKTRMIDWKKVEGVSNETLFDISSPYYSLVCYNLIDVTIPAGESVVLEFDYSIWYTYRLDFIAGKYCDVECEETVVTLEKSDKVVIFKQNMGFDETAETSTVTLDPDKEDYYIDYRVEGYDRS